MSDFGETLISLRDMMYLLGTSRQRIDELAASGVLQRTSAGKYKMAGIKRVIDDLKQKQANVSEDKLARAKWTETKTQIEEMKRQLMSGEAIRYDEALSIFGAVISIIRTRMLALPSRCAPRIFGQASSTVEVAEIIREEVSSICDYVVQAKQAAIDSLKPRGRAAARGAAAADAQAGHADA